MLFRLSDVYKSFGAQEVLRGTSFQINPGEHVGLVGRNGAGKTTIFRLVTEEESPDRGEVARARGLKLGLLAQHVHFDTGSTVHESALAAFGHLQQIEHEMHELEHRMADAGGDLEKVLSRYSDLQTKFEREGGFEYSAKAESVLQGLGFDRETWQMETEKLSGGQQNRLGLARLLLSDPDVLLLDEPTNHLDVSAVEWLEEFLQTYSSAFVIISHDRYFLDRACVRIIEMEHGRATSYKGNYSDYLVEREERREIQQRAYDNQQRLIAKTEEFIRRNLAGQKTKQAKSRRTMLQRLDRVEAVRNEQGSGDFRLQDIERTGTHVLTVNEATIGYPNKTLARDISLILRRGECLGVIGPNGSGKTTFIRTILGNIPVLSGELRWGAKVQIGYYAQQLEDLDKLSLAKLIYSRVNGLVLDEPTNHLDIPSREALEAALDAFEGTIITISHDRYFLDRVATQMLALDGLENAEHYNGDYTEYHDWKAARDKGEDKSIAVGVDGPLRVGTSASNELRSPSSKSEKPLSASRVRKSRREKRKLRTGSPGDSPRVKIIKKPRNPETIEAEIDKLERRLSQLSEDMARPEIARDITKLVEANENYRRTEGRLAELYDEWERAETTMSSAKR